MPKTAYLLASKRLVSIQILSSVLTSLPDPDLKKTTKQPNKKTPYTMYMLYGSEKTILVFVTVRA